MKKTEIVQLVLIILGVSIIFKITVNFIEQINLFIQFSNDISKDYMWILIVTGLFIIMVLSGFIIIFKSKFLSRKIIKDDSLENISLSLTKSDILHLSIIILCLFFLVQLSPTFIALIYAVVSSFINDFALFKDTYPPYIWSILLYILIIEVLIYSNRISTWLERKLSM